MKTYHDLEGDGGSRVLDQVLALRQRLEERLAGVRHRLAVGSGKGGVGKSTLTMQLAAAFAARGWEVAILDADLNGPSQARLGGLAGVPLLAGPTGAVLPRTRTGIRVLSTGSVLAEREPLSFPSVAEGESQTWRATRERTLLNELVAGVDWGRLDLLLVDLPPGPERTAQHAEFLGPEAAFVLVSIPSALAHGVVARSVEALRGDGRRVLGYVENMAGYWCAGCRGVRPLFPEDRDVDVGVPCLARVPFDPALAALSDAGTDGASREESPVAEVMASLAERLRGLLEAR